MSTITERYTIEFPSDYDAQSEFETPSRGYLSEVVVRFADGSRYQLYFVDPVRLQQELTQIEPNGQAYFAEPNLVVLPLVNTMTSGAAVDGLVRESFFEHLKPLQR